MPDNRVSLILYDLPVSIADPVERLATVREEMGVRKGSHMSEAGEPSSRSATSRPQWWSARSHGLVAWVLQRLPQRSIDTITTNVPGPQFPLYCLGREMIELRPFVPIAYGIRHSTGIMSYNGRLFFGVTGDFDGGDDVERLAAGAVAAIGELHERATAQRRTASSKRRPKSSTRPKASSAAARQRVAKGHD